jgi:hypothetical protein
VNEYETYSWAGTDAKGVAHAGRTGVPLAQIALTAEHHYRQGWRSLRVARGWVLPDAGTPDLVAAIGPHPEAGRRIWWAEGAQAGPEDAERAIRAQLGETDDPHDH